MKNSPFDLLFWLCFVSVILVICAGLVTAYFVIDEVSSRGLKVIFEEIWYGPVR